MNWQTQYAAKHWPGYTVREVNGTIAVVYHCCHEIEFVQTPMEARVFRGLDCGPGCVRTVMKNYHAAYVLEEPRPEAGGAGVWERDK
jgi:hypothetical protein